MSNQIETNFKLSNGQTQVRISLFKDGSYNIDFFSMDGVDEKYNTVESNQKATITLKNKQELEWLADFFTRAHELMNPQELTCYSARII